MSNWIFVIRDTDEELYRRIKKEEWPLFQRTANRGKIRVGDKIVFYKAGTDGQRFKGEAIINSKPAKKSSEIYFVQMKDIVKWEKPVLVKNIIMNLIFIKNKESWGNYFQGGVRPLPERDYKTIISAVKN